MQAIPRIPGVDGFLELLKEEYPFIANRCRELGSDVFQVRLLMQETICMSGGRGKAVLCMQRSR